MLGVLEFDWTEEPCPNILSDKFAFTLGHCLLLSLRLRPMLLGIILLGKPCHIPGPLGRRDLVAELSSILPRYVLPLIVRRQPLLCHGGWKDRVCDQLGLAVDRLLDMREHYRVCQRIVLIVRWWSISHVMHPCIYGRSRHFPERLLTNLP